MKIHFSWTKWIVPKGRRGASSFEESSTLLRFLIGGFLVGSCSAHTMRFTNACSERIFVGILNNPGKSLPEDGGFRLLPGEVRSLDFPNEWAGRFWGRTGCTSTGQNCETGRCGGDGGENCQGTGGEPPVSLAEITFDAACCGGIDFYDVSLVDGYNLPLSMEPIPGTFNFRSGDEYDCRSAGCNRDLNDSCPAELQQIGRDGGVVACRSACETFDTDEYCCRGAFGGGPHACPPFYYSQIFKDACPRAYSYAYDDVLSTFTCLGTSLGASGYDIKFCPGDGGNTPPPPPPPQSGGGVTDCGCPNHCTASVLEQIATDAGGSHSCRDRINYVMATFGQTEEEACLFVSDEFPAICGQGCNPQTCNSAPPPPPPPVSVTNCGCESCTTDILESLATDSAGTFTCRARIDFVISFLGMTEQEACAFVSDEFPSICGQGCDPESCNSGPPPPPGQVTDCGCASCTDGVLDRPATDNAGTFSCRDRMNYIMATFDQTEQEACAFVSDEFPLICGEGCDPDSCNNAPPAQHVTDCGCATCTDDVLARVATDSAGSFSCRDRMNYVMTTYSWSEQDACELVSEEFPSVCGQDCHPQMCAAASGVWW